MWPRSPAGEPVLRLWWEVPDPWFAVHLAYAEDDEFCRAEGSHTDHDDELAMVQVVLRYEPGGAP